MIPDFASYRRNKYCPSLRLVCDCRPQTNSFYQTAVEVILQLYPPWYVQRIATPEKLQQENTHETVKTFLGLSLQPHAGRLFYVLWTDGAQAADRAELPGFPSACDWVEGHYGTGLASGKPFDVLEVP